MEPASTAMAAFSTLKELYLLSKFVLRVISSAIHHRTERESLHLRFRHEFLFLKSFGLLLVRSDNTAVNDDELDSDWLRHIGSILEQLRVAYSDYAKLAAAKDDEYKRHSPYSFSTVADTQTVDFSLEIEEVPNGPLAIEEHKKGESWLSEYCRKVSRADWRWALFQKRKLEEVLTDLRLWNGMLKELVPVTLAARRSVDGPSSPTPLSHRVTGDDMERLGLIAHAQLRKLNTDSYSQFEDLCLSNESLQIPELIPSPPLSFGVLSQNQETRENVLVEFKPVVQDQKTLTHEKSKSYISSSQTATAVVRLANLLRLAGQSDLRTLPFVGYLEKDFSESQRYAFVFRYPEKALETSPVSLHKLIASSTSHDLSLTDRFAMAQKIAKSLWTFHTDNWVHKSVRSQSVVFFYSHGGTLMSQNPFLINFEYSRPANQNTSFTWDQDDEKNLFRHPDRYGPPLRSFDKTHDLYALGVVLLEIGLWQTAFDIREEAKKAFGQAVPFDRYELKKAFIGSAKQHLPRLMGVAYRDAVLTCLVGDFSRKVHDMGFGMEMYRKVVQNLDMKQLIVEASKNRVTERDGG